MRKSSTIRFIAYPKTKNIYGEAVDHQEGYRDDIRVINPEFEWSKGGGTLHQLIE